MNRRTLASTVLTFMLLALALPAAGASGGQGHLPPVTSTGMAGSTPDGPSGLVVRRGEVLDPLFWELKPPALVAGMDSVVQWALADEGLWVVGGYGSGGAVQRYDLGTETWSLYPAMPSPQIEYPVDGCYGLDDQGHEVVVLFPDATGSVVGEERVWDITAGAWVVRPTPPGFPEEGLWAPDIVSLYAHREGNYCLISGGASAPGGGDQTGLWSYSPDTNEVWFLGNFTHIPAGFDFHASWYVPWLGASGSVCVAGGVDSSGVVYAETQCYDLGAAVFNVPNADLGLLPQAWWGMADGFTVLFFEARLWLADGVDATGALLQASAYYQEGSAGFAYGPPPAAARYRLEGDAIDGKYLHVVQGSSGGFTPTTDNQLLVEGTPVPCQWQGVVMVGFDDWSRTGLWNLEYETDPCGSMVAPFPPPNAQAAYYGDDTVCNYADGGANSGELTMPFDFDLTGAVEAYAQLSSYENTECGGDCAWDNRFVEASGDGGQTWTVLGEGDTENAWYSPGFSLGAFLGGPVRVRFRFDTVDGYANEFFGWMVDNVEIFGCFPPPENTMHLGDLQARSLLDPYGRTLYIFKAQAHDADHQPLGDVQVTAEIFPPHGGLPSWRTRITKPTGWARFSWGFGQEGTWHFCISDMDKEGYVYWWEDNDVPVCVDVTE